MNNYGDSYIITLCIVIFAIYFSLSRNVDEHGMDEYDRWWGIAGEGRERGVTGMIYTNGNYDLWANLVDHNPWWD